MKKWEYKRLVGCDKEELNYLGNIGWELVSHQIDRVDEQRWNCIEVFIFKRELDGNNS